MELNSVGIAVQVNQSDYSRNVEQKGAVTDNTVKQVIPDNTQKSVEPKELGQAVDIANKVLFKNNTHLQFKIHDKTRGVIVKIVDDETGDVVKEIPPEKMLDMVAKLWEIAGIIVDERR